MTPGRTYRQLIDWVQAQTPGGRWLTLSLLLWAPSALALNEFFVPEAPDVVFYTVVLCTVAFSAIIAFANRQTEWLIYVFFSVCLIVNAAATDGMLYYLVGGGEFVLWVVPFYAQAVAAAVGFLLIGLRIDPASSYASLRKPALVLAVITALFPLTSYFWLKKISLALMWQPVLMLWFTMMVGQILPPLSWRGGDRWQLWLIRGFPIANAIFLVTPYLLSVSGTYVVAQEHRDLMFRVALLMFAFFSLLLVVYQAQKSVREKEQTELRAAQTAQKEAELQLELARAEQEYQKVLTSATRSRTQLATVSHDLKQPIASLRQSIRQIQKIEGDLSGDSAARLSQAVDFVDQRAASYTGEEAGNGDGADHDPEAVGSRHDVPEIISTGVLLQTLVQMFQAESEGQNVTLRTHGANLAVRVVPLPLMRILSNLIANVLSHAEASRCVVGFRPEGEAVRCLVIDDGAGMSAEALARARMPGFKGEDSAGEGLGLAIVTELCRSHSLELAIDAAPGQGTCASILLPRA